MKELDKSPHTPVLLDEVLKGFGELDEGLFIDCTLGYGGHSKEILLANPKIELIGIDRDIEAIEFNQKYLKAQFKDRVELKKGTFSDILPKILEGNDGSVVGVLADFGVSSLHLDKKERGFSFG